MPARFKFRLPVKRILKVVAVAILVFIAAGFVYEEVEQRADRRRLPQIGQSVDIGGRSMNIYCSGEGSPAVILESGGGGVGYGWELVEPGIAKFTRACRYHRAGEGWSESPPEPRSSTTSSDALNERATAA